jgi:hypothetical protein
MKYWWSFYVRQSSRNSFIDLPRNCFWMLFSSITIKKVHQIDLVPDSWIQLKCHVACIYWLGHCCISLITDYFEYIFEYLKYYLGQCRKAVYLSNHGSTAMDKSFRHCRWNVHQHKVIVEQKQPKNYAYCKRILLLASMFLFFDQRMQLVFNGWVQFLSFLYNQWPLTNVNLPDRHTNEVSLQKYYRYLISTTGR